MDRISIIIMMIIIIFGSFFLSSIYPPLPRLAKHLKWAKQTAWPAS